MRKNVLILSDHGLNGLTPDIAILKTLAQHFQCQNYSPIVVPLAREIPVFNYKKQIIDNIMHFIPRPLEARWYNSKPLSRIRKLVKDSFYYRIYKKTHPTKLLFFCYPNNQLARIFIKRKIPFTWIIYDPFFSQPGLHVKYAEELLLAKRAVSYWVPRYFYEYHQRDISNFCHFYSFPLLPDFNFVKELLDKSKKRFEIAYFGNFMPFRNPTRAIKLFRSKYDIHVFTDFPVPKNVGCNWTVHKGVKGKTFYECIAASKILLVFDNDPPYESFFPSKIIHFVAFGLPLLIFGQNKNGSIVDFLKTYDNYLYVSPDTKDEDVLDFAMRKMKIPSRPNKALFASFEDCLPSNVWSEL